MNTQQITTGDIVKVQGRSGYFQVNKINGASAQLVAGGVNLISVPAAKIAFFKKPNAPFKGI